LSSLDEKSPQILQYFKLKGKLNTYAFIDHLKSVPSIRITPHSGQMSIIDAYEERIPPTGDALAMGLDFEYKYRFLVAACGRRFGKSVVASLLGAEELLIPYSKVLICSYTLDNCEVIFKHIRSIIKGLGVEITMDRTKDLELELVNGSTLRVASIDNVESKLGTAVSLLIVDEAKLFHRSLYETILLPMTLDYYPYSRSILISSPQTGWFESYYNYGQSLLSKWERYWSLSLPSSTNPTLPRGYLAEMEATTPPDIYAQEYLGLFTSAAGLVCREFSEDNIYDPAEYEMFDTWMADGNTVFHTIDSGYSHYFAGLHIMYVEEIDTFFVFHEYQKNKTITQIHADNINSYELAHNIPVALRYADPAASQQIADFVEFDLYFNKSLKNLRETITCINTLFFQLSSKTGLPRLLISKECPELLRQVQTVQWKEDADEQTREKNSAGVKPFKADLDQRTDWDMFDAFRYGMFSYMQNSMVSISSIDMDSGPEEEVDPYVDMMAKQGYFKL
jgi:hypothetical protein